MLPSGVSRSWLLFCFCLLAFDLIKRSDLTCIWTQISIFPRASTLRRDRISAASMGPAGKLINIRQGEGSIEEYAGRFWEVARRSATEKTCLLVFFWGGLAEPLRARMPYWNPEESLEGYLNLALRLSGSAFRVESAAEPVCDSSQAAASAPKAPEVAVPAHTAHEAPNMARPAYTAPEAAVSVPTGEPTASAPEPAPFREPTESAPEPAPFREPTESAPESAQEPAPFREPRGSAPEPAPSLEPRESAPEPAPFREPTQSAPFREPTESAHKACEVAAVSAHGPPALPAPPWHLCLPLSPGPLPLHRPGPPNPPPTPSPLFRSPCWALGETSGSRSFKGGVVSGVQPGVLLLSARGRLLLESSLHSTHLCTHSSLHSTHLCTYSSLSAVPNVWTIYAPHPRPSVCRDYFYQHSHVHGCISLCL